MNCSKKPNCSNVGLPVPGTITLFFITFFCVEAHADEIIKVNLFLNRLSYFKQLEMGATDGRQVAHEAFSRWLQPHDLEVDFDIPGTGAITITKADMAPPFQG